MDVEQIMSDIVQSAYEVRGALKPGFLEKVYENAMAIELRSRGYEVKQQVSIDVRYKGYQVGDYIADLSLSMTGLSLKSRPREISM